MWTRTRGRTTTGTRALRDDKENYVDSDQGEDYYWDESTEEANNTLT